jgi:MarR family 2-MHQ and catechol resistance regulon transcriptional repressor
VNNRNQRTKPPAPGAVEDLEAEVRGSSDAGTILEAARFYRETFGADADSIAITLGIRRANALVTSNVERAADTWDLGADLSRARLSLLRTIYFGEGHRQTLNELGRRLKVSRTNITNLIDGLERDGLVSRTINPVDRRLVDAQLTPKGVDVASAALPRVADLMESFGRSFSADERRQFADLLTRFIDELSKRSAPDEAS